MLWLVLGYPVIWIVGVAVHFVLQEHFGNDDDYVQPPVMVLLWLFWPFVIIWLIAYVIMMYIVRAIKRRN